ncbi:hypothetical protein AB0F77_15975 [Streptomyces sp. NPDC026672]|uniref:hypothetical protein n=1 Tax=unclassified Streptomyces TaxID=2593676 RepID=UPI0033E11B98
MRSGHSYGSSPGDDDQEWRVMGRWCTARWRAGARRCRRLSAGAARGTVVGGVLCLVAALPGAGAAASGTPGGYAFAPDARLVAGASGGADAVRLEPGRTYRSSILPGSTLSYRLELDAGATAYVPVTAVPPADATVSATDGVRVRMQDEDGDACSYASARFGAGLSPRPVTALATRETGRTQCAEAGTYYVVVERVASGVSDAAPAGPWDLELAPVTEPGLVRAGATEAPGAWDSATPGALAGEPRRRDGGAGFASARTLGRGVWRADAEPGGTLFYKVPVDWGQRLHATAELGGTTGDGGGDGVRGGYVSGALNLSLYNPVRGDVDDTTLSYSGTPRTVALHALPPVEYRNRYGIPDEVRGTRFAGDYYLVVHLNGRMAETFGPGPYALTLRVRVDGAPHSAPGYAGASEPRGLFEVTAADRAAAGTGGDGGAGATGMRVLAAAGIGTGSALLVGLGVWTAVVRRRAGAQTRTSAQKPTA